MSSTPRAASSSRRICATSAAITGDVRVFGRIDYLDVWNEARFVAKLEREAWSEDDGLRLAEHGI